MNKKTCSICKTELPFDCFSVERRVKDGRRSVCKTCTSKWTKERSPYWNPKYRTREARRAERKKYGDPTKKQRDKRYKENNKAKIKIRDKTYRSNKDQGKCSISGCNRLAERHHTDYNSPDHFIWLCKEHHIEEHQKH